MPTPDLRSGMEIQISALRQVYGPGIGHIARLSLAGPMPLRRTPKPPFGSLDDPHSPQTLDRPFQPDQQPRIGIAERRDRTRSACRRPRQLLYGSAPNRRN